MFVLCCSSEYQSHTVRVQSFKIFATSYAAACEAKNVPVFTGYEYQANPIVTLENELHLS